MIPTTITTEQLSLGISSHNNHYLFSDHYLNFILKNDPRWKQTIVDGEAFLAWVTAVFHHERHHFPHYSESQLEEHWFKPILKQLGHVFEGQARIPTLVGSGIKVPDYIFFPNEAIRQQAVKAQQTADYVQQALAVGEVKKWQVPLGKKSKGAPTFDNNNPSFQIDYYLRATDLTWGILSNGRLWRLVHKDTSYKLDVYFQIDIVDMIEQQNRAAAVFFVLFFRQAAFRPDEQGRVFLQDALATSAAYALQLEADLRDNAYKALEHLIQGFIEPQANGLTADSLPAIYTNSLYLLYRIIFLFYGESRGLLPIEKPEYQSYSLTKLARDIAVRLDNAYKAPPMTREYWGRLKQLFTIISGEQPDLNAYLGVPRYNGGLFNPNLHPFLEKHFVGDRYLLAAIDAIARREVGEKKEERRREPVDYRTLGVRQLGSIYEGLLEYQPRRAGGPMVAVKTGKGEEWLPESQKPPKAKVLDTRHIGDIYLVTDKGERKATGSYYTPDYIVKYMVEQALGPLVNDRRGQTADGRSFAEAMLQLNILDPAMGSGHFLVEATDYLARAIATETSTPAVAGVPTVPHLPTDLHHPAGSEPAGGSEEDDLVYWRRQVVERCIYGVDKNPMAVELAKLSLWLVTVARDKPLSFLDHHLRHGDSLMGARLADLNSLPVRNQVSGRNLVSEEDQPTLFDESAFTQDAFRAVGGMMTIEKMLSESIDDIHHKEVLLAQLQAHLARWRRLADLWTSHFFGNELTAETYADLARFLQGQGSLLNESQRETFLNHSAVQQNDYFHWELEFPEVFWDEFGRFRGETAGFDAVIGNPPYVRQEQLKGLKPFFAHRYKEVYAGTADLFVYFFKLALDQLRHNGLTSYISSNSWLRANYATALRAYLREKTAVKTLIDLGDNRVFEDAPDLYPAIHVVQKHQPLIQSTAQVATFGRNEGLRDFSQQLADKLFYIGIYNQPNEGWRLESQDSQLLAEKILSTGNTLSEVVNGKIYRGILTGLNDAFIISRKLRDRLIQEDPNCSHLIKPVISGAEVRSWYSENEGFWLIAIPNGWTRSTAVRDSVDELSSWQWFEASFPSIAKHLSSFTEAAKKRMDQGEFWWELRPCNYWNDFNQHKIFYPEMSKFPRFVMEESGLIGNKTSFMIPLENYYLLGILMSRVIWFAIQNICQPIGERAGLLRYTLSTQFMGKLPIPNSPENIGAKVESLAKDTSSFAKKRYQLHCQTRHRIQSDLGTLDQPLNEKLTTWWELDFPTFRQQIKTVFKRDIPLKERDDWETYLAAQRAQHDQLTAQIITHETELNRLVYDLFDLNTAEIALIETSTKYPYGAV